MDLVMSFYFTNFTIFFVITYRQILIMMPPRSYLSRIPILSSLFIRLSAFLFPLNNRRSLITSSTSNSISDLRKEYSRQGLDESLLPKDPHSLFNIWFQEACDSKVIEPNAMCLSTCKDNKPSARIVLLKAFDEKGFVWFTNYESRKGMELEINPNAALTFWWGDLERSVRVEGMVEKISEKESEEYFHSRPRNSQIGAWSSNQSKPIASREELQAQEVAIQNRFSDVIPKPSHWGGFRLVPSKVEFWKGREGRLHDRILFEHLSPVNVICGSMNDPAVWTITRLQP